MWWDLEKDLRYIFFYNKIILITATCASINSQVTTHKAINMFIYIFVYYSLHNKSIIAYVNIM
jgi:hypothetical protein